MAKHRELWPSNDAAGEANDPGGEKDPLFRRNLAVIALLHLLLVGGLYAWGRWAQEPKPPQVIWLDGGSMGGGEPADASSSATPPTPEAEGPPIVPADETPEPPAAAPPPSELTVPKAPAAATPRPATPKPAATPKPVPKATPKATPLPKATPKATPRPKSTPRPKATPDPSHKPKKEDDPAPDKLKGAAVGERTAAKPPAGASKPGGTDGGNGGKGAGPSAGAGKGKGNSGTGAGAGAGSQFGWYHSMIRDRFYSVWQQPTSIVRSSADFVTRVKIRIAKDGTILSREITTVSGNTVMDDSVMAAAQKVTQIDALPTGLGGETYEVSIDFKLDQGG